MSFRDCSACLHEYSFFILDSSGLCRNWGDGDRGKRRERERVRDERERVIMQSVILSRGTWFFSILLSKNNYLPVLKCWFRTKVNVVFGSEIQKPMLIFHCSQHNIATAEFFSMHHKSCNTHMVIVVGNGHGHTCSNPERDRLHFT